MDELSLKPIGVFCCEQKTLSSLPRQPGLIQGLTGHIELLAGQNFEQALEDLKEFERLWIVFHFHKVQNWKACVLPPGSEKKRGLFSTRSPHRPNPIGLSCVRLKKIDKRKIYIEDHDLLDGTPILDIKPYLPYVDSHPNSKAGWTDKRDLQSYSLSWSALALEQYRWLLANNAPDIWQGVRPVLEFSPKPSPSNRVKTKSHYGDFEYLEMAYQTWRIIFSLNENEKAVELLELESGYDENTLKGEKTSPWDDVPLHQLFSKQHWMNA